MCYSAQVSAESVYDAIIDIRTFHDPYVRKRQGDKLKTPKTMNVMFNGAGGDLAGDPNVLRSIKVMAEKLAMTLVPLRKSA